MKIRIKGNSIRMRLSRTEVEQFGREGYLEERTEFGNQAFVYALGRKEGEDGLSALFAHSTLTMQVPAAMVQEWVATDVTGYSGQMKTGEGTYLSLLLEKDFKCIDADVVEDQSDNYENPLIACK